MLRYIPLSLHPYKPQPVRVGPIWHWMRIHHSFPKPPKKTKTGDPFDPLLDCLLYPTTHILSHTTPQISLCALYLAHTRTPKPCRAPLASTTASKKCLVAFIRVFALLGHEGGIFQVSAYEPICASFSCLRHTIRAKFLSFSHVFLFGGPVLVSAIGVIPPSLEAGNLRPMTPMSLRCQQRKLLGGALLDARNEN